MSVSYDFSQADRILQFMGFVEALSNPETLKAQLNEMKTVVQELRERQGLISTMDEAHAYHAKLAAEAKGMIEAAKVKEQEVEDKILAHQQRVQDIEAQLGNRASELERTASTLNRLEVDLNERIAAHNQKGAHMELREAHIQSREAELKAKEQEFEQRAARLRAAVGG